MADVFLSYARPNARSAARVAEALRGTGLSVWYDTNLPAHRSYTDVIEEQLDAAAAVVVLWSKDSVGSQWVRSEANRARETGRLVQLRLDGARLPMPFDQIQCADLRGWNGDRSASGWRVVEASVGALVGGDRSPPGSTALPARTAFDRRTIVASGAALATTAAGLFWLNREPPISTEAQLLLQKGMDALQANDVLDPEDAGSTAQAIALLVQATRLAPNAADGWGALALAYAARRRASPVAERPGLEARGQAAAREALRLDPSEPRALAAQLIMAPLYRNWRAAEQADREALRRHPRFPILLFVLSDMLGSVGRYREATELSNRLDRSKFLLPGAERKAILNLWSAGNLAAADEAIVAAIARWPDQRQVWRTRVTYLLYTGRANEALAVLEDVTGRPRDIVPGMADAATATAKALVGSISKAEAISANLDFLRSNPAPALAVLQAVTALGDKAIALDLLRGYYFREGSWSSLSPPGGNQDLQTSPLFQPPMQSLWRDPRFAVLLRRIGLEDYWRQSGTQPDFRRSA
jgi:tetratricopeptide (TPR) repeat protein